ncbi:hypothetical protein DW817_05665 [Acidaminococcus sp. AM33-14BH]|nr:hypothetical protein DW817_05665 [Acidaminococcus sp. AM33-14BH]
MRHILASGSEDHLPGSQALFEAKAEGRRDMFPGESFRPRSPMRGRFGSVPLRLFPPIFA